MRVDKNTTCPITGDSSAVTYFTLQDLPLVNNLCSSREESLNCTKVPIGLQYFPASKLTSLTHFVDSSTLFSHYLYKSSVNTPYISHCRKMFKDLHKDIKLRRGDLIVDIGGNDGTLLKTFRESSKTQLEFLNIDGSENLTEISKASGIDTLCTFFNEDTPLKVSKPAKLVISTNVFQHLQDINSFAHGVKKLLAKDGVWVLEFPYWLHDMETNQFDQIYHEHMYYYLVTPLAQLFSKYGLDIIRVTPQKIHGGTLRLHITHTQSDYYNVAASVQEYLDLESKITLDYYQQWGAKVYEHILGCKAVLEGLKKAGKTLIGFAASAKGTVFLNAAGITDSILDVVIDDTDLKQGKFIPGTGLEIKSRAEIDFEKVDFVLILSHNFSDYIIRSLKDEGYEGQFIVCLPELKII